MKDLKLSVCKQINALLDIKITEAKLAVQNARESRDNETKSSAGDKHETGRAMSQIELDNAEMQLAKVLDQKRQFTQIDFNKNRSTIEPGCLVKTNNGLYLISIGLGRIHVNNYDCFVVSIQSPIGKVMFSKQVGQIIYFQDKEIEVLEVL